MDPLVAAALVTAVGAFATALVARHLSSDAAEAKAEADQTTNELAGVKIQLDAWPSLYQSIAAELEREKTARQHDVAEERAIAESFAAKADRLQRERDGALEELAKWRQRVADLTKGGEHDQEPNT